MHTEQEKQALLTKYAMMLENEAMGTKNFDSTAGFDSTQNLDVFGESVLNMAGVTYYHRYNMTEKGLSTFSLSIFYVDNSGSGLPVRVTLFQDVFNDGLFVGNNLVFTNGAGDTATVVGRTGSYRALQIRSRTQPFRIAWTRWNPVSEAQFSVEVQFDKTTVFGSGKFNRLNPDEFLTPDQFQLRRVDFPMNYKINSDYGYSFDVNDTEVQAAGGLRMSLYIDQIMDPIRALSGKNPVQTLAGDGIIQNQPSIPTSTALNEVVNALGRGMNLPGS